MNLLWIAPKLYPISKRRNNMFLTFCTDVASIYQILVRSCLQILYCTCFSLKLQQYLYFYITEHPICQIQWRQTWQFICTFSHLEITFCLNPLTLWTYKTVLRSVTTDLFSNCLDIFRFVQCTWFCKCILFFLWPKHWSL